MGLAHQQLRDGPAAPARRGAAAPPPDSDAPGATLGPGGRFLLRRRLGQGGFGTVFEALDQERGVPRASKTVVRGLPVTRLPSLRIGSAMGRVWNLLYLGQDAAALAAVQAEVPVLRRLGWMRSAWVGVALRYLRAQSALQAAGADAALLRLAARDAGWLERQRLRWADALAAALRAGLAWRAGQGELARRRMRDAAEGFAAAGMLAYHIAARWREGAWAGDDSGAAQQAEAAEWLRGQGVADPARFTRVLVPE